MQFSDRLYAGKKAAPIKKQILECLQKKVFQPEVYVITPPKNGNHILDIYPSALFQLPSYREKNDLILGIAVTYWEALEVVRDMVEDMYQTTGAFRWESLFQDSAGE